MKSFLLQNWRLPRTAIVWCNVLCCAVLCCAGCSAKSESPEKTQPEKSAAENRTSGRQTPPLDFHPRAGFYAHLLPAESVGYVRLREVQQVLREFIRPQHLRNADQIQQRLNTLLRRQIQHMGAGNNRWGVSGATLLSLLGEVQEIHVAILTDPSKVPTVKPAPAGNENSEIDVLVFLRMSSAQGLRRLLQEMQPKLLSRNVGSQRCYIVRDSSSPTSKGHPFALCTPLPQTLLVGPVKTVERLLSGTLQQEGRTLQRHPAFRRATEEFEEGRPLFVFADFQVLRSRVLHDFPLPTVGSVAGTLGLDGGLTLRAYAAGEKEFPAFLRGGNRERKFLSRIPAEAVFLISHKISDDPASRRNFMEWLAAELNGTHPSFPAWIPTPWTLMIQTENLSPDRIEYQAFAILQDLWNSGIPAQSETAWFVAPDKQGRWGTAFLFDVKDRDEARKLVKNVFRSPKRISLPWKQSRQKGLTIHYLDFEEIARQQGHPVSPRLKKLAQLQVGYAEDENLFYVGTVSAIEFAHHPQGKTLADAFPADQIDEQNTLLILLQPGRVLHSTFGVEQIDRLLARFAAEIPPETSYAVTLKFEPRRLTFRSDIPFVSLAGWILLEMLGEEEKGRASPASRPKKAFHPVLAPKPYGRQKP